MLSEEGTQWKPARSNHRSLHNPTRHRITPFRLLTMDVMLSEFAFISRRLAKKFCEQANSREGNRKNVVNGNSFAPSFPPAFPCASQHAFMVRCRHGIFRGYVCAQTRGVKIPCLRSGISMPHRARERGYPESLRRYLLPRRIRRQRQRMYPAADIITQNSIDHPMPVDARLASKRFRDNQHPKMAFPCSRRGTVPGVHLRLIDDVKARWP